MARKQEQEPARDVVTEVAPGVNCHALVDPGPPGPLAWRAIRDRLRKADLEARHVHTVIEFLYRVG